MRFLYHLPEEDCGVHGAYKLAGIFNCITSELTDVSEALRGILKVSKADAFRRKCTVRPQLEQAINQRLLFYLEQRPEFFYALGRKILPRVSREKVEEQARILQENGISSEEVWYQPDYSFEKMACRFTDQVYLLYLEAGERAVDAIARQWVKEKGAEMFRKKILYACIRESLADLERRNRRLLNRKERQAQKPN